MTHFKAILNINITASLKFISSLTFYIHKGGLFGLSRVLYLFCDCEGVVGRNRDLVPLGWEIYVLTVVLFYEGVVPKDKRI